MTVGTTVSTGERQSSGFRPSPSRSALRSGRSSRSSASRSSRSWGSTRRQFGLLVGTPILTGSLIRLVLGIWTDQYGGRRVYTLVMLSAAVATFLLTYAHDLSAVPARGPRRRHCRRLVRGRRRLCLALVSRGQAGHRARHLRRRQCRRGRHQVRRALRAWSPMAGRPSRRSGRRPSR